MTKPTLYLKGTKLENFELSIGFDGRSGLAFGTGNDITIVEPPEASTDPPTLGPGGGLMASGTASGGADLVKIWGKIVRPADAKEAPWDFNPLPTEGSVDSPTSWSFNDLAGVQSGENLLIVWGAFEGDCVVVRKNRAFTIDDPSYLWAGAPPSQIGYCGGAQAQGGKVPNVLCVQLTGDLRSDVICTFDKSDSPSWWGSFYYESHPFAARLWHDGKGWRLALLSAATKRREVLVEWREPPMGTAAPFCLKFGKAEFRPAKSRRKSRLPVGAVISANVVPA